jgi:hypothetical protein
MSLKRSDTGSIRQQMAIYAYRVFNIQSPTRLSSAGMWTELIRRREAPQGYNSKLQMKILSEVRIIESRTSASQSDTAISNQPCVGGTLFCCSYLLVCHPGFLSICTVSHPLLSTTQLTCPSVENCVAVLIASHWRSFSFQSQHLPTRSTHSSRW